MLHKITLILACLCLSSLSVYAEDKPLILGVHPYKTPSKLVEAFTPLASYLSEVTNRPVKIHISKDYQSHIDNIGNKKINIAYLGPASYVQLVNKYGKKPLLARQEITGKPTFQGKIIVRRDSTIKSMADLKYKRFAFGDPNSTMSHLVPRSMLMQAGIKVATELTYKFLGSHDNVALGVLSGDYDAGAVKEAVYYKYEKRGLRVLATTPALSEHLLVTCGKVSPEMHNKIAHALFKLKDSETGRKILRSIKPGMTAMQPVKDSDYDNLRHILDILSKGAKW